MSDDLTFWSLVWNRNGRWFGRPSCIICRFILQLEASGHLQRPGVNWGSSYLMELQGLCPSLAWREDAGGVFRRAAAHSAGRCRLVQALVWFCIASMFSSIFWEFMRNIGCRCHSNRMLHHDVSIWVLHIFAPGLCGQQVDIANICPKVTSWQGPTFGMWKILDLFIHLFHVSSQNVCIFARVVSPAFCAADATRPIQTRPWITAKDHEPNQCCNSTETHLDEISDTSSKRWTRPNESLWRLWRLQWIWRLVRFVYTL